LLRTKAAAQQTVGRGRRAGVDRSRLILYAPCEKGAVWLMNDHFINDASFTLKFDDESLQLDDPKSSALLGC